MEPFDEVLNHQVYALEEERMAWEATISAYRRNGAKDLRTLTEGMLAQEKRLEYHPDILMIDDSDLDFEVDRECSLIQCYHNRRLTRHFES
jgi:hypothetical protein